MGLVVCLVLIATTALASTIKAPTIGEDEGKTTLPLQTTFYRPLNASSNELKVYLAQLVAKYGGNYYELYNVINCESGWKPDAKNPKSTASGISQFLDVTWKQYCEGEKKDPYAQLRCMVKMFNDGNKKHWECFKVLYN